MAGEGLEVGSVWVSVVPRLDKNFTKLLGQQLQSAGVTTTARTTGQKVGASLGQGVAEGMNKGSTTATQATSKFYAKLTQDLVKGNDSLARAFQRGNVAIKDAHQLMLMDMRRWLQAMGRSPAEVTQIMNRLVLAWRQGGTQQLATLKLIHSQMLQEFNNYNAALAKAAATSAATARSAGAGSIGGGGGGRGSYFGGAFGALGAFLIPIAPAVGMAALVGGPWIAAASLAGIGLATAVRLGFESGMKLEMANIQFETLLGPAADEWQQQVQDFAARTPFALEELRTTFTGLVAAGLETEQIIPVLTGVGDALSALGFANTDGINRATYAIKQIVASGRVYGTELRQLTELNIPIVAELAAQLGVTQDAVRKLVEEGKVGSDVLIKAFTDPIGPLKQFEGIMDEANATFTVALSNFKDSLAVNFGTAFLPILQTMAEWLNEFGPRLAPIGEALAGMMQPFVNVLKATAPLFEQITDVIGRVLPALGQGLAPLFNAFVRLGPVLVEALEPVWLLVADFLGQVTPLIASLFQALHPVIGALGQLFAVVIAPIAEFVISLVRAVLPIIQAWAPLFTQFVQMIAATVGPILNDLAAALIPVIQQLSALGLALIPAMTPVTEILAFVFQFLGQMLQALIPLLPLFVAPLQILIPLVEVLTPIIVVLADVVGRVLAGAVSAVTWVLYGLVTAIRRVIEWAAALISKLPGVPDSVRDAMNAAVDAVQDSEDALYEAASSAGASMVNGLAQYSGMTYGVGYSMGANMAAGLLRALIDFLPPVLQRELAGVLGLAKAYQAGAAVGEAAAGVLGGSTTTGGSSSPSVPTGGSTGGSGGSSGSSGSSDSSSDRDRPSFTATISIPYITQEQRNAFKESINTFIREAIRELKKFDKYSKEFEAKLRKQGEALLQYGKRWEQIESRLGVIEQVADQIKEFAGPTNALTEGYNSAAGIQRRATDLLRETRDFQSNLKKMRKAGASGALIADIMSAGVVDGNRMMEALLAGNKRQDRRAINGIDQTLKRTARIGEQTGLFYAKTAEELGTEMGGGIIKGLQSRQKQLENMMQKLAKAMAKSVKKELGIKSPSRVFAEIGGNVGDGLAEGVLSKRASVEEALAYLMPRTVNTPRVNGGALDGLDLGGDIAVYIGDEKLNNRIDFRVERRVRRAARGASR